MQKSKTSEKHNAHSLGIIQNSIEQCAHTNTTLTHQMGEHIPSPHRCTFQTEFQSQLLWLQRYKKFASTKRIQIKRNQSNYISYVMSRRKKK